MLDARIVWWSNSPAMQTGYGRPSGKICRFLHQSGYDVLMLGQQTMGSAEKFDCQGHCSDGVTVLPMTPHHMGQENLAGITRQNRRNLFFLHYDPWGLPVDFFKEVALLMDFVFYGPIDHAPLSPLMIQRLQRPICTMIIAQTLFGKRQVEAVAPERGLMPSCGMIPATVDASIFKPLPEVRKRRNDEKKVRFCYFKANKGERANFPSLLKAFRWFTKEMKREHNIDVTPKDAELYLHTQPDSKIGFDLSTLVGILGLRGYVTFPHDYCSDEKCLGRTEFVLGGYFCKTCKKKGQDLNATEAWMAAMLNYCTAQFNTCDGEGFGIPIVESLAAGTPVFHTNWAGGVEHIPQEWRLKIATLRTTVALADQAFVDEEDVMNRMVKIYREHAMWLPKAEAQARRIGQTYDDKLVLPQWLDVMKQLDDHVRRKHEAKWGLLADQVPGGDIAKTYQFCVSAQEQMRTQAIKNGMEIIVNDN